MIQYLVVFVSKKQTFLDYQEVYMNLVNYRQQGAGPDVILIHGLFGSLENLNMVAKDLASDYRVTSLDVRNHGRSFHQNDMNYQALANDVIHLLDHLHIQKVIIVGHSMGGKVAAHVALANPERVDKLIMADIAPVPYPPHHNKIIQGLLSIDLASINKRSQADEQLAKYVDDSGIRQFLLRNLTVSQGRLFFKCNLDYIASCYEQIIQGYQGEQQYTGPTLFIKGGKSDYIRLEHKDFIAKIFPKAKARVIHGAGHWLHAEKTERFNKIVADFLRE
jgi:esterase